VSEWLCGGEPGSRFTCFTSSSGSLSPPSLPELLASLLPCSPLSLLLPPLLLSLLSSLLLSLAEPECSHSMGPSLSSVASPLANLRGGPIPGGGGTSGGGGGGGGGHWVALPLLFMFLSLFSFLLLFLPTFCHLLWARFSSADFSCHQFSGAGAPRRW